MLRIDIVWSSSQAARVTGGVLHGYKSARFTILFFETVGQSMQLLDTVHN